VQQFAEIKIKDITVPLKIVRSRRNKYIRLTITEKECRISMPILTSESQIQKSLKKYKNWIYEEFKKKQDFSRELVEISSKLPIPFKGKLYEAEISNKYSSCTIDERKIYLPDRVDLVEFLNCWYLEQAYKQTIKLVGKYHYLCTKLKNIKLKSLSSRWGSCSERGNIALNWRLILAPPDVLEYVFVHELCHFKVQSHSKEFWLEVEKVMPDFNKSQKKLKENSNYIMNFPNCIKETRLYSKIEICDCL
jgi:predicted metal-dependent hydrolase